MKNQSGMALVTLLAAATVPLAAQSWPQWRGPNRDGRTPVTLPPRLATQPTPVWTVKVGAGHASPIIEGGRAYVFTRRDDRETLSAIDLTDGRVVWTESYPALYEMNPAAAAHGKGPKSTPVLHAGRICTLGISGILSCVDAASGKLVWRKSFEKEFKATSPDFGAAMSPIVVGDLLIAHVGGQNQGALRAFDLATGAAKWSWTEDGPAYASPVLVEVGGDRQIVTQTQKFIVGIDPAEGKTLWKMPFTTDYEQNAVTPLPYKDMVVLSGLSKGTFAVRIVRKGSSWTTERVWEAGDVSMYMSSPVVVGDVIYGFSHRNRGQAFALDAATGKTLWTGPPRQGENAALVASGDRLLLLTNESELIIFEAKPAAFKPLVRFEVAQSPTWGHPVLLGDRVLIKDEESLSLLKLS